MVVVVVVVVEVVVVVDHLTLEDFHREHLGQQQRSTALASSALRSRDTGFWKSPGTFTTSIWDTRLVRTSI